jgi:hypothetical protein
LGFILLLADQHHRHNHTCDHYGCKSPKDNPAPLDANPKPVFTVAATVNLASQDRQNESFPESPAAFDDVVRMAVRTLHRWEPAPKQINSNV